jgi:ATP-binding cassette subfamily F protein uup
MRSAATDAGPRLSAKSNGCCSVRPAVLLFNASRHAPPERFAMPLLTLTRTRLAFGHYALLETADLQLDTRERIGLIGRNGSGKSSLLRVLAGLTELDDGERWASLHLRIALVAQEPDLDPQRTVFDAVALGLGAEGKVLSDYHHATALLADDHHDARLLAQIDTLQAKLDASNGWVLNNRVEAVLSRLGLPADTRVGALSGGWKKRVSLAQALAAEPDVLLLDEPTNHLDLAAIAWLEGLLQSFAGAVVCITHDRRFLDAIATRIVELDRGKLRSYPGNFSAYQTLKAQQLADEAVVNAKFDKVLAQEEVWIRKGVEARRTRNEGRVLRLEQLRRERAARRDRLGKVNLQVDAGERSGQMVAELINVSKGYDGKTLIRNFSTRVLRGDRIGLIGPNGAGKSTLLKLILGELQADAGTVRTGANRKVAYFDQLREQLEPEATLIDTINPGADYVEIGGSRKHVISYLGDFLFAPERARSPVKSLSGGERNRLLLARLFAQPANVLVLDEPTNDLDIETLELLEAMLQEYPGTIFLVSHDRAFLDNVVTQTIAFEGDGVLREYAGGYSDWAAYQSEKAKAPGNDRKPTPPRQKGTEAAPAGDDVKTRRQKLSYQEERELGVLPARIETLEVRIAQIRERFADPALYIKAAAEVKALQTELDMLDAELAQAYARWEELETRKSSVAQGRS